MKSIGESTMSGYLAKLKSNIARSVIAAARLKDNPKAPENRRFEVVNTADK